LTVDARIGRFPLGAIRSRLGAQALIVGVGQPNHSLLRNGKRSWAVQPKWHVVAGHRLASELVLRTQEA
jgi:hypothetical protein